MSRRLHLFANLQRRLLLGVCLLAVPFLIALSGRAAAAPPTSVAVGDSITNLAREEIMAQFTNAGWSGGVAAVGGLGIGGLRPYIQYIANGTPALKRMFLFAGTNNALAISNGEDTIAGARTRYNRAVHDVIDVRPRACVFLVTLNRQLNQWVPDNPYSRAAYLQAVDALNAHMFDFQRKYPKVRVIDWNQFNRAHDDSPSSEDDWLPDNIHPNQTGQNALADYYRFFGSQVSGCGTTP